MTPTGPRAAGDTNGGAGAAAGDVGPGAAAARGRDAPRGLPLSLKDPPAVLAAALGVRGTAAGNGVPEGKNALGEARGPGVEADRGLACAGDVRTGEMVRVRTACGGVGGVGGAARPTPVLRCLEEGRTPAADADLGLVVTPPDTARGDTGRTAAVMGGGRGAATPRDAPPPPLAPLAVTG